MVAPATNAQTREIARYSRVRIAATINRVALMIRT
jgi:hypothetical protein